MSDTDRRIGIAPPPGLPAVAPHELDLRWRRGFINDERCALLMPPGAFVAVIPCRATVTGKRMWRVVIGETFSGLPPARWLAVDREALRHLIRDELARLGWHIEG